MNRFYRFFLKRFFDFTLSFIGIAVLGIPMLIIAAFVRIYLGKPVLFTQERIGKDEKPFKIYKFRSMRNAFDEYGVPLPDEQRLTKFGKLLRSTSLDELPSLWNILKGDMSIVGPRPLPSNYLPWYTEEERIRHTVRGGLTGLAQVNGRNATTWEERFQNDIYYVRNLSFKLDLSIIFKTIKVVFKRENIGVRGVSTPVDFHVYRSGKTERELDGRKK